MSGAYLQMVDTAEAGSTVSRSWHGAARPGPPGRGPPRRGARADDRGGAQQPADVHEINDGFVSTTYSHLGSPARGVLVAETWGETGWSDAGGGFEEPNTNQGWRCGRSCRAPTTPGTATSPPRPVRWSDNRLSNLSFEMPAGYVNLDAHRNAPAATGG